MLPFVKTSEGVNVFCNGKNNLVRREHVAFKKLMGFVNDGDEKSFLDLLNTENVAAKIVGSVNNGTIELAEPVYNLFVNRLDGLVRDGLSVTPLLNFVEKLVQNPSYRSVKEAYQFIERNNLPITEDGDFLAYKSVRSNYFDKHSGKFDNKPGSVHEMPRNKVDDDCERHCSYGFHVGAYEYAGPGGHFNESGDHVMIVKASPADIVSVPSDYDCQKCRVCKYSVVSEYSGKMNNPVYTNDAQDVGIDEYDGWYPDDFEDLEIDDDIVFMYRDKHSDDWKMRHATVMENDLDSCRITARLRMPEDKAGEVRSFSWERMDDVKVVS
jgi:hypothetical protein